jgi:hypothetical protein
MALVPRSTGRDLYPLSDGDRRGIPGEALQQLIWRNFERPRQLDKSVDPREPNSALEHPDLGPMQPGTKSKLILGEGNPLSLPEEVLSELCSDVHATKRMIVESV